MANIELTNAETRYQYYSELHYIPVKDKTPYWAAQVLYFNKGMGKRLVDPRVARFYRGAEKGEINEKDYKAFVDPVLPDGTGGEAKYFTSDWKVCPVFMHLENIQEAEIKKIPINLAVKAADEFFQLKKQQENARILGKQKFRTFINEMNKEFGLPQLRDDQDPFKYVDQMVSDSETVEKDGKSAQNRKGDIPVNILESLQNAVKNDRAMALYNEYIYKDGAEIACELGIDYYMNGLNHFTKKISRTIKDIKNFNTGCMQKYTSLTTGLPEIRYHDPSEVFTAPFKEIDGSDNTFWYTEFETTFGEFTRMVGAKLSKEQLKDVFDLIKEQNKITESYENVNKFTLNSAKFKLGFHAFESQDYEVYVDYKLYGNSYFKKKDDDFQPSKSAVEKYSAKRVESHYNVWRSFYYIPLDTTSTVAVQEADFTKQSKYIFDFGKIFDQMREGDDNRYSKSNLVIWKNNMMSFSQIVQSFAPHITHLWHQIQNDFSQSKPDGVIWADEVITSMMKYVDSGKGDQSNASTANLKLEYIRLLNQTGSGIGSVLDKEGNPHNVPAFQKTNINSLATAGERMIRLMELYSMMRQSLGISEVGEGQDPKQRQNFKGINAALIAGSNSRYFIQEGYMHFPTTLGEMLLYHIKEIIQEGGERLEEFTDMVGEANSMAVQCIKDIPLHRLALKVEPVLDEELRAEIHELAKEMAAAKLIEPDMIIFLKLIENVKYAYAILSLKIMEGQERQAKMAEQAMQMEQKNKMLDHQLKLQEIQLQGKIKSDAEIILKKMDGRIKEIDAQIKLQGQLMTKDKIRESRTEEQIVAAHLDEKGAQRQHEREKELVEEEPKAETAA